MSDKLEEVVGLVGKWRDLGGNDSLDVYYADGLRACADELESALLPGLREMQRDAARWNAIVDAWERPVDAHLKAVLAAFATNHRATIESATDAYIAAMTASLVPDGDQPTKGE